MRCSSDLTASPWVCRFSHTTETFHTYLSFPWSSLGICVETGPPETLVCFQESPHNARGQHPMLSLFGAMDHCGSHEYYFPGKSQRRELSKTNPTLRWHSHCQEAHALLSQDHVSKNPRCTPFPRPDLVAPCLEPRVPLREMSFGATGLSPKYHAALTPSTGFCFVLMHFLCGEVLWTTVYI